MPFFLLTRQLSEQIINIRWASVVTKLLVGTAEVAYEIIKQGVGWGKLLKHRKWVLQLPDWADLSKVTREEDLFEA
jgi:hypothetical protein